SVYKNMMNLDKILDQLKNTIIKDTLLEGIRLRLSVPSYRSMIKFRTFSRTMVFLSESWKVNGLAILIVSLTLLYFFLKRTYSYWERNGFKTLPNYNYILGHFKETLAQKEFVGDFIARLYNSTSEPFVGIYSILRPILLVRDPELIRLILIKDFSHFTDRDVHCNEEYDPLSGVLFSLPGKRWKNIRTKLTPAFSSGKLKAMFGTLHDCGSTMQNYLEKYADNDKVLEVRDLAARYTTNVIASVGFGLDIDSIGDPNNDFRVYGAQVFEPSISNAIRWFFFFIAPKIMSVFRIHVVNSKVDHFARSITRQNLEYREKNNIVRKDFFQLLIQIRNAGTVQLDDDDWSVESNQKKTLSENEIAAIAFNFFAAGFETSSTTLSFCLYELSKHPEIQKRVHNEIDRVLKEHDGKITFESISDMKYLGRCFDETLRMYPTLPIINRTCTKEYRIPGTNKVIEKGTPVYIPVIALQMDDKYYDEPKIFNPDRFNEENTVGKNIVNRPYLSFGDGPRNCIAARLGKIQTKVGLVMMLQKFRFELPDQYKNDEIKFSPKTFLIAPFDGINLHVFKRNAF
ncbi:probable cytochrome P450 6d5, partial [Contarinia nasturtii]|uniref:probable cytochrome P450 6d5 n=1 Tax=Contarinia nasturtii TaxID=265458 RepID=UPI0012D48D21